MEFTGQLRGLFKDWESGEWRITFSINENEALEAANELNRAPKLSITAKIFRQKRSLDANSLLWKCIDQIARNDHIDKWDVYLQKIKAHGKCYQTTIVAEGLETLKDQWREVEVIGKWKDDFGVEWASCLCYPGSHLYNTKEFSDLLEDIIQDMKDAGLQPPTSEAMRRSLEEWEKLKNTQH